MGEFQEIAEAAAERAVQKTFLAIGVDIIDSESVIKMQADFHHLRVWRESTEAVKQRALLTCIGVVVAGILGYAALLFSSHH